MRAINKLFDFNHTNEIFMQIRLKLAFRLFAFFSSLVDFLSLVHYYCSIVCAAWRNTHDSELVFILINNT